MYCAQDKGISAEDCAVILGIMAWDNQAFRGQSPGRARPGTAWSGAGSGAGSGTGHQAAARSTSRGRAGHRRTHSQTLYKSELGVLASRAGNRLQEDEKASGCRIVMRTNPVYAKGGAEGPGEMKASKELLTSRWAHHSCTPLHASELSMTAHPLDTL